MAKSSKKTAVAPKTAAPTSSAPMDNEAAKDAATAAVVAILSDKKHAAELVTSLPSLKTGEGWCLDAADFTPDVPSWGPWPTKAEAVEAAEAAVVAQH